MIEQQNNIPDSLVDKVRKLLSLSKSDNPNEAELALTKAQKLALEYNLDLASINIHEKQKDEPIIKSDSIENGKRESTCQKYINWLLNEHFNIRSIHSGSRYYGRRMVFIGKKTDVELASYINDYLNEEMPKLWRNYYKNNPGVNLSQKQGYLYGVYEGLSEKLNESKKQVENERFEEIKVSKGVEESEKVKECYALTVKSSAEKLSEAVKDFYPHLRKAGRSPAIRSYDAVGAGRVAGKNISLRRPIGTGTSSNKISY